MPLLACANFSKSVLRKVDIIKILSCDRICVQNMNDMNLKLKPLRSENMEELRRLCYLYTGDKYTILNGLLRGKVRPLYNGCKLKSIIKAYEKKIDDNGKMLQVYQSHDYKDSFIVPLDIYEKIKDDCHNLAKSIKKCGRTGLFWRLMDTVGLRSMLKDKSVAAKIMTDTEIKNYLKLGDDSFIRELTRNLRGKIIEDNAFLSTSASSKIEFTYGIDKKSVVLKISTGTNKLNGMLVSGFSKYDEKEFLLPPNTKLQIVSVTRYNGKPIEPDIFNGCIQVNCVKSGY